MSKFKLGDRVELTEAAKDMFPLLSRSHGTVTGRLPKSVEMPYRIKWDRRANIEPFAGDFLQEAGRAVTIPRAQYDALMATQEALTLMYRTYPAFRNAIDALRSAGRDLGENGDEKKAAAG